MARSKASKDEESIEEKLIGKSIVDPNGDIIGKCIGIIEDEKKKKRMRIAIKTELGSVFEVEETIPVSLIKQVGEVILLKKTFEIEPIPAEDLVTFEIVSEIVKEVARKEKSEFTRGKKKLRKGTNKPTKEELTKTPLKKDRKTLPVKEESVKEKDVKEQKDDPDSIKERETKKKTKSEKEQEENQDELIIEITENIPENQALSRKIPFQDKEMIKRINEMLGGEETRLSFEKIFSLIKKEQNGEKRRNMLDKIIGHIELDGDLGKEFVEQLLNKTLATDTLARLVAAEALEKIAKIFPKYFVKKFTEGLKATYSEPSKEIQERLISSLASIANEESIEITELELDKFFEKLLIKREICKDIPPERIHGINLEIFANNFTIQGILIHYYLLILNENESVEDFAKFLQDFNATIIAFSMINFMDERLWDKLLESNYMRKLKNAAFLDSIRAILDAYQKGDIKRLSEKVDPKLGVNFSERLIMNTVKMRIEQLLVNITIFPLDILLSLFEDSHKEIEEIVCKLINNGEIDAQFVIVEDKTFITAMNPDSSELNV